MAALLKGTEMRVRVSNVSWRGIRAMRDLYRKEMGCQIVHDSWHERGFTRSYLIRVDERVAGYGSVGGVGDEPRDMVKEFFLHEIERGQAHTLFHHFVAASGARRIEAQTNDRLLTRVLAQSADHVDRHTCLFEEGRTTSLILEDGMFRRLRRAERERVFRHELEPVGDWVIDVRGEIVATGGLMLHYNPPFADVYMEVAAPWRRCGIGAFLVQQLKRVSRDMRRIPAARCSAENTASRRTLEKAGMIQCGWIARGALLPGSDRT